MMHLLDKSVEVAGVGAERHEVAGPARRGFLSGLAVAALSFLPLARKAAAQVCYDQYGRPVAAASATVVAPAAVVPPAAGYYGPASAVSQTRQVARRTSRRTGRREGA